MRLTKFEHSCVRLESATTTVVVDPGGLTDPAAARGADAVLITHEHFDHFEPDTLRAAVRERPDLVVWAPESVAARLAGIDELTGKVHVAARGDAFDVGDVEVNVYGEWHAPTHMDPVRNVGYRLGGRVFHPGDAFTVPEDGVDVLLLPANAPWSKALEVLDYAEAVGAGRGFCIHEGLLNDIGLRVVDGVLAATGKRTGGDYQRLAIGESVELP